MHNVAAHKVDCFVVFSTIISMWRGVVSLGRVCRPSFDLGLSGTRPVFFVAHSEQTMGHIWRVVW
jgi:hypothetical protein